MMNNNSDNKKRAGYTVYVATWINWQNKMGAYGCSIFSEADGSLFYRDYAYDALDSPSHGEIKALVKALSHIPVEEPVLLKTSQPAVMAGINYSLISWIKQNWQTKKGHSVKSQEEWQKIHDLIQGRKILALQTQEDEFNFLQNTCREFIAFYEECGLSNQLCKVATIGTIDLLDPIPE